MTVLWKDCNGIGLKFKAKYISKYLQKHVCNFNTDLTLKYYSQQYQAEELCITPILGACDSSHIHSHFQVLCLFRFKSLMPSCTTVWLSTRWDAALHGARCTTERKPKQGGCVNMHWRLASCRIPGARMTFSLRPFPLCLQRHKIVQQGKRCKNF